MRIYHSISFKVEIITVELIYPCMLHTNSQCNLQNQHALRCHGSWRKMWQISSNNRHINSLGPDLSSGVFVSVKSIKLPLHQDLYFLIHPDTRSFL